MAATTFAGFALGVPARGGAPHHNGPTCVGLDNIGDMLYTAKLGLGTPPQVAALRLSPTLAAALLPCSVDPWAWPARSPR